MQAVLKKLFFKGQSPALVLNAPPEAKDLVKALGAETKEGAQGSAAFIVAFAPSMAVATKTAKVAAKALAEGGNLWVGYPKGSSKKYKGADLNRDTLHKAYEDLGFTGVSLIAFDDDWSLMRFKKS